MLSHYFSTFLRSTFIVAIFSITQACAFADDQPSSTRPASTTPASYRIKSVIIPSESAWRKDPKLHQPPDLFVIVRKDGEKIGSESDDMRGWQVEYPKNARDYYWIDGDDSTSYTVEVWDDHNFGDVLIVSIINLKMEDFKKPILEKLSTLLDSPDRAVCIEFQAKQ